MHSVGFATCFVVFLMKLLIAHGFFDDENCGRLNPNTRHYIYGGKSTQIEQWPWQVSEIVLRRNASHFLKSKNTLKCCHQDLYIDCISSRTYLLTPIIVNDNSENIGFL